MKRRGHSPFVYSPVLGEVAQEIHRSGVPVASDLNSFSIAPDLIHGHHHLETMTALLRFPRVPAVYFYHGWVPWEEIPPRIHRYVAVDIPRRDFLIRKHNIPEDQVRTIFNFVDLERFQLRAPLPLRPKRALIFSNSITESDSLRMVQQACRRLGISLDAIGLELSRPCAQPEKVLGNYDLVFAKGRCALEAMASGTAVILCDSDKIGQMVTPSNMESFRLLNFAGDALQEALSVKAVTREIARYHCKEAREVSEWIRKTADLETALNTVITFYQEVLEENVVLKEGNGQSDFKAAANYLQFLSPRLKEYPLLERQIKTLKSEVRKKSFLRRIKNRLWALFPL